MNLHDISVPPSSLTPADLLQSGRRSVRRRRYAAGGAVMAVLAIAAFNLRPAIGPSTMEPSTVACTANLLQGGKRFSAEAVDPTGRYIAGGDQLESVMLWDNGIPQIIALPVGSVMAQVEAINSRGVVLGMAGDRAGKRYPWVYRDGTVTKLPDVDGEQFYEGRGINTAGDIVGVTAKVAEHQTRAVIWPAHGPVRILAAPQTKYGTVADTIGDDGTVVGNLGGGDHPYVWGPDGIGRKLAENPVRPGGEVRALSGEWAAGWVSTDEGPGPNHTSSGMNPGVWNIRTGEFVQYRGIDDWAVAVSRDGDIVTQKGELVVGGKQIHLPMTRGVGTPPTEVWIAGMSHDAKTIIGYTDSAAVWRC